MYIYISTLYEIWNSSTSNIKTANYDDFFLILLSKKNQFFFDTSLLYVCFVGSRSPRPVHEVCWRHGRDMLQHGKGVFYLHLYVLLAFASPTCIMSFLSFLWVYIPVLHVSYVWGMLGDTEETHMWNTEEVCRYVKGMYYLQLHVLLRDISAVSMCIYALSLFCGCTSQSSTSRMYEVCWETRKRHVGTR